MGFVKIKKNIYMSGKKKNLATGLGLGLGWL